MRFDTFVKCSVSLLMLISSAQVAAQQGTIVGIGTAGSTGSILNGAGTYTVQTYDQNVLEKIATSAMINRQDEALKFLKDTTRSIEVELLGLVEDLNSAGGLVELYKTKSAAGQLIDLPTYLGATQDIVAKVNVINTKIQGLFLIPGAVATGDSVEIKGEVAVKIPAPLKVQIEGIQNFYKSQFEAVMSQVRSLSFRLSLPNGERPVVTGIDFMPTPGMVSPEQLNKMREEAVRARMVSTSTVQKLNELNIVALENVRSIIRAFGTSQRYRFQLNAEGKETNLANLMELMWARDYLRSVYGVQLGALSLKYDKQKFHLDFLFSSNKIEFLGEFVRSQADLIRYQDDIATALHTASSRHQEVFGEGVKLVDRIMSGVTWITGETQLAAINAAVLVMLKRDIEHEVLLTKPGGMKEMRAEYRKLYYQTAQMEAQTRARAKAYMPDASADDEAGFGTINDQGTIASGFAIAVLGLDSMLDMIEKARKIEEGIRAIEATMSTSQQRDRLKEI